MRQNQSSVTVVAMTIAEVFLLLMFVMWLGTAIKGAAGKGTLDAALLQAKLIRIETDVRELRVANRELNATVEALRIMLGAPSISREDLKQAFDKKLADTADAARRGKPKCAEDNVLIDVEALDGAFVVRLAAQDQTSVNWLPMAVRLKGNGGEIEAAMIPALLDAVMQRYAAQDCRFDYRLRYRSAEDYHSAREKFEAFFYPARIRHTE
ncbi:MAG: hypothetical protein DMF84_09180 [Acidobacteria bacterium]|nr:MAG: hypothetical protein DMF84_09180 [Acidobacteriota bacterium]